MRSATTTLAPLLADPDLAGDRGRGERMVARDHDDPDPGGVAAGDGFGDLGARRVQHRDQPQEAESLLGLLARRRLAAPDLALREREHAQPFPCVALDPLRDLRAGGVLERRLAAVAAQDGRAAGQHRLGGALGVEPGAGAVRVDRAHQLELGVEVVAVSPRASAARRRRCRRPARSRQRARRSRSGRRSRRRRRPRWRRCTGPPPRRARRSRGRPRLCGGWRRRAAARRPSVHAALGRIRFSVIVPVLSVQITSVLPSVSTALSRLTSAPRRASRLTATASARVMTGSSPSGTLPASSPTANTTLLLNDSPAAKIAIGTNAIAMPSGDRRDQPRDAAHLLLERARLLLDAFGQRRDPPQLGAHPGRVDDAGGLAAGDARAAEHEVARLEPRHAGVLQGGGAHDGDRLAGQRREVDLQRAGEQPHVRRELVAFGHQHDVPGNEVGRVHGPARRRRAARSRAAACTRRAPRPPSRPAAPGRTRTPALSAITSSTATAIVWLPTANESAAATQSSSASGCVSWRASSAGQLGPPRRSSTFGPYWSSRRSASWLLSPPRSPPRSRSSLPSASSASTSRGGAAVRERAAAVLCSVRTHHEQGSRAGRPLGHPVFARSRGGVGPDGARRAPVRP